MVEYGVLVAHNTAGFLSIVTGDVYSAAARLNWEMIAYVAVGLVFLRLVSWAFKPTRF